MNDVVSLVYEGQTRRDGLRPGHVDDNYADVTIVLYDIGAILDALAGRRVVDTQVTPV